MNAYRVSLVLAAVVSAFPMPDAAAAARSGPPSVSTSPSAATKNVGVLMSYVGRVRYWGKLVRGPVPVVEGSFIETEKDSNCSVLLGHEVVVHIGPESRLEFQSAQIEQLKRAQLNFPYGKGRFLVRSLDPSKATTEQRFDLRVRSRAAVLGVRGTQFVVDSPREASEPQQFVTIEGKVAIDASSAAPPAAGAPATEIPAPGDRAVVVEKGQAMSVARTEESTAGGGAAAPLATEVGSVEPEKIEEIVGAVAPPPKPLLLAGQVNDSLLPHEDAAPGTSATQPGASGGEKQSKPVDPFATPPSSDFSFSQWGASSAFDAIAPAAVQGSVGLDPVVDAILDASATAHVGVDGVKQGSL